MVAGVVAAAHDLAALIGAVADGLAEVGLAHSLSDADEADVGAALLGAALEVELALNPLALDFDGASDAATLLPVVARHALVSL